MKSTRLPPELQAAWEEIEAYAKEYGLDFFPIIYEVLDYRTLYAPAGVGRVSHPLSPLALRDGV
jgi:hypothetical protein